MDAFCVFKEPPLTRQTQVITGFNTDIEYQGVTYHVQTEDKGLKTPLILSLVYDRGTILASKRSPYDDLLDGEFDEKVLAERLQKQHKLICAAIRAGRIEDLKRMTMKEAASKKAGLIAQKEIKVAHQDEPPLPVKTAEKKENIIFTPALTEDVEFAGKNSLGKPVSTLEEKSEIKTIEEDIWDIPLSIVDEELVLDEVQIVEEEIILPAEAVEIITDSAKIEPIDESLKIELPDDVIFKSGERKNLSVTVRRGKSESGLGGAHIMVKIIGSSFRPLIFHSKTDQNGVAVVPLQLPHFRAGRAAILVKAMAGGEEVELRRVIQHSQIH